MPQYPKRLIEVDLPIKRISAHARREKSIRHGHISTLHIWWARRPLAACRAVICASLWPDPVDELCPEVFRERATEIITAFAKKAGSTSFTGKLSEESGSRWIAMSKGTVELDAAKPKHWNVLRYALLDFIADFANWDNSIHEDYLETSRALTQAAHEALGGEPGTRPLVVDPFAGGGSIPLEALRVGADAFASDLNPVAVLLNKVVLEYIPKYGQRLADEVRKWGQWVKEEAEKELAEFYPKDPDGSTSIAYLWARTIICEGPGCGIEVPLVRSTKLGNALNKTVFINFEKNFSENKIDVVLSESSNARKTFEGTTKRGSVTCPCCGYTTPSKNIRIQMKKKNGGAENPRLLAKINVGQENSVRQYKKPLGIDINAFEAAKEKINNIALINPDLIPDQSLDVRGIRHTWAMLYGLDKWENYFSPRQKLAIITFQEKIRELPNQNSFKDSELLNATQTCLSLSLGRSLDYWSAQTRWTGNFIGNTFGRQALPFIGDFVEAVPFTETSGGWSGAVTWVSKVLERESEVLNNCYATVMQASATDSPLPEKSFHAFVTDPPYYDAVPYSYLADYFYVWEQKTLKSIHPDLFSENCVPKDDEIVVDRPHELSNSLKTLSFYQENLEKAFLSARNGLQYSGIGVIVFASKNTASWEAILQSIVSSGWVITGSWAIDTERQGRVSAIDQARLQSSIHIVCRPRENPDGSLRTEIGDWRDVLQELPQRIHDWMPRLADEGVVGADAIFACLGPALEIFSRYSSVEKASGEEVTLREYLEYVWGAVSKEALGMIFTDADTTDFEEDARLTAMWLWTLSAGDTTPTSPDDEDDDSDDTGKPAKSTGYTLEYDAARKIAQGLGAHLDKLTTLVEIKGDKARLLPVGERAQALFGKEDLNAPATRRKKKSQDKQLDLFAVLGNPEDSDSGSFGDPGVPQVGKTVLDRLHQSMILFAAGRSEALKRFLVEEGIGADQRYWKLAQAFSALYPTGTDEKRWVDGVLARKKGLGF